MKKTKKFLEGLIALVVALTVFVSPLSDYLPIIGEGLKVSAAEIALESVNVHITSYSDSRVTDALNRISQQAGASSSIRSSISGSDTMTVKDLIVYFLNTSKYKVFGGQSIPYEYSNAAGGTTYFTDGKYKVTVSAAGCLAYAKWVRGVIYKSGVGNEIKYTKGELTADKLKDMLVTNGQAGETIHVNSNIHSIVFISCDDNGFYYIDWSGSSSGSDTKARFRYITYENFVKYVKSKSAASTVGLANRNTATNSTDGGTTPDPVTLKNYNDNHKNTITDTNAILYGQVDKPKSYPVTKIGIRIRVDGSTYDKGWSRYDNTKSTYTNSTYMYPFYNLNEELNLKLTHATTYYFQFYAVVNGKEYWSAEGKFTTTGSHSYGSWKTTKEATCTESGTQTRTCSCGAKETKTIAALGHNWSTAWSKDGSSHWHVCTRCSATHDKANHSWNSGTVTKQPTCTAKGEKTYTCTVCKATKTESVAALGHSWSSTWSRDGSNHWHVCTRCNATGDKATHSFKAQTVAPTGSSQGYTLHTCSVCSYSYKDNYTSANTGCSHKNTKEVVTNATCNKDGVSETVCKDCGNTVSSRTIPATGVHTWDKGKETKKATCAESGITTYTCTVCSETKTETTAALGHSFSAWEVTEEATETQEGQRSRVCERCGETETETVPMLGQSDENETVTTTPEPDTEGVENGDDDPASSGDDPVDEEPGTDGDILLVDEVSKIELSIASGIIPDKAQLVVIADSENQTDTRIEYDIALVDASGSLIQPEGSVTVRIPVPAEWTAQEMCIYRAEDDGTYTDMKVDYDGGYAVFTTDHFSTYVLTASAQGGNLAGDLLENNGDISENGENNSSVLIYIFISVIVVLAAAVAVMSVLMVRKRR